MNADLTPGAPQAREKIFAIPAVVVAFTLALLAIHGVVGLLSEEARVNVYFDWGFVPARVTAHLAPGWVAGLVARAQNGDVAALGAARMIRDLGVLQDGLKPLSVLTYALLHASWAHVGVNSVWLVAFGPPAARRFGAARFTLFFFFCAVAGAAAHWLASPFEAAPMIGASASVSGLMAAAARFMFRPGAPFVSSRPATLRELACDRRALIFVVIWMATNFAFGAGATTLGGADGPVAWVAHIGGFAAGLLCFGLFDPGGPEVGDGAPD